MDPKEAIVMLLRSQYFDPNVNRNPPGLPYTDPAYKQWIFPDWPNFDKITKNGYPRISVTDVTESNVQHMGCANPDEWDAVTVQIDTWALKGELYNVDGENYEGQEVANKLMRGALQIVQFMWRQPDFELPGKINVRKLQNDPMPFDEELSIFRRMARLRVDCINPNEFEDGGP